MGFLNLFKRSPAPARVAAQPSAPNPLFSQDDTTRLHQLFTTPREHRDDNWRAAFFAACWNAATWQPDPAYFDGPDGLPYYRLNLPSPGMRFEVESLSNIARECVERNAGVAFFADGGDDPGAAQWVISMGEIDSLIRFGSPEGDPVDLAEAGQPSTGVEVERISAGHERLTVTEEHQILVGSPSADFLPPYTARAIHRMMNRVWGIAHPRVALVVDHHLRPSRNLVIGRRRNDFGTEDEGRFEMQRISWMLPPGRGLMLMPDEWSERQMTPLTDLF